MARKSTRDSASPDRLQDVPSPTLIDVARVAGVSPPHHRVPCARAPRGAQRRHAQTAAGGRTYHRLRAQPRRRGPGLQPQPTGGDLPADHRQLDLRRYRAGAHRPPGFQPSRREPQRYIARLWGKLCWAGASVGRSGLAAQAIDAFDVALWNLKTRRAGLSPVRLLGAIRCVATTPLAVFCIRHSISC